MWSIKNLGRGVGVVTIGQNVIQLESGKSLVSKVEPSSHTSAVKVVEIPVVDKHDTASSSFDEEVSKAVTDSGKVTDVSKSLKKR